MEEEVIVERLILDRQLLLVKRGGRFEARVKDLGKEGENLSLSGAVMQTFPERLFLEGKSRKYFLGKILPRHSWVDEILILQ